MKSAKDITLVFISSIIITLLFHRQALGLNLLIIEAIFFVWLLLNRKISFSNLNQSSIIIAYMVTAVFTVVTHSVFSILINQLVLVLLIGILIYPEAKSLLNTFKLAILSLFSSQLKFIKKISNTKVHKRYIGYYLWGSRIFLIPIIVIVAFIFLYKKSNPVFDKLTGNVGVFISDIFSYIFKNFDALIIVTFLIGLVISNFILLRKSNKNLVKRDSDSVEILERKKTYKRRTFNILALKHEFKAGIFLLIILNALILLLNVIDIKWVWFGFEWEGQTLKQFVHEGTYLLILSILISIALVLFFFRKNLNFYKKNSLLKILSYIWLAQNAILTFSVGIRNFYYIKYFSLAYKRIGVIIFLILVLYGLFTVYNKVKNRKSSFYLFKANAYALFAIMVISSTINWDNYIAKYNFNNSHSSFLHLNYMASLSAKALPNMDVPLIELNKIAAIQTNKFPMYRNYMSPDEYRTIIDERKILFKQKWESKNLLSWNLPEYLAYKKLFLSSTN